jgi:hypothetical protein
MARHRLRRQGVKVHRDYTVDEVSRQLGVAKGTVRRWMAAGLPCLTDQKPSLIQGADLVAFLKARAAPRHRCLPHECYCVKCRAPRPPAGGMAEFAPMTRSSGRLSALCPVCGTFMHRQTRTAALPTLGTLLDISIREAPSRLVESRHPSPNDHLAKEPVTHA